MNQTEILKFSIDRGEERKGRGNILRHEIQVGIEFHNIEEPFRSAALEAAGEFEKTLENIFAEYPASKDIPYKLKTKSVWDTETGRLKKVPIDGT